MNKMGFYGILQSKSLGFTAFSYKLHIVFIDFFGQVCYNSDRLGNVKSTSKYTSE